jgi:hypothetical protein
MRTPFHVLLRDNTRDVCLTTRSIRNKHSIAAAEDVRFLVNVLVKRLLSNLASLVHEAITHLPRGKPRAR